MHFRENEKRLLDALLGDVPDTDEVVGVTGEEGGAIGRPGEGDALDGGGLGVLAFFLGFLLGVGELRFQASDALLGFEVPDHDGGGGGGAQPVPDGREAQSVDDVTGFQRGEVVAQVEVPEHSGTVLTTRSAERTIGRHGNGVNVASVAHEVGAELAVVEVPDLDDAVPTGRDDERNLEVRAETDAGDPFLVAIFLDGVLALTESVPQVDSSVARTRHNLTVIGGEGNGEDILGVTNEAASGGTTVQVPETESTVARTGEGELTIGRDGDILDEVGVTSQTSLGDAGLVLIIFLAEGPHDEGFVARSGQDHVGGFHGGSDGSDPSAVSLQLPAENKFEWCWWW